MSFEHSCPRISTIALMGEPGIDMVNGGAQVFVKPTAARKYWAFRCTGTLALTQPELVGTFLMDYAEAWTMAEYQVGQTMCLIGRICLKTKRRMTALQALAEGSPLSQSIWYGAASSDLDPEFWELDTREGVNHPIDLAMGQQEPMIRRIRGPWSSVTHGLEIPAFVLEMEAKGMYPWQRQLVASIEVANERIVNFVVDERGNSGKSTMGMWLLCRGYGQRLAYSSNPKEISAQVMDAPKRKCFIIDLPRVCHPKKMAEIFGAVEEIKNGYAHDTRYKFRQITFQPPAIWMFANALPDFQAFSLDRWRVWEMGADKSLRPHPYASRLVGAGLRERYGTASVYTAEDQFTTAVVESTSGSSGAASPVGGYTAHRATARGTGIGTGVMTGEEYEAMQNHLSMEVIRAAHERVQSSQFPKPE